MLGDIGVMTTACWRPYYLRNTLDAWLRVRGVRDLGGFWIALGRSDRLEEAQFVIEDFRSSVAPVPVHVHVDDRVGPWRAIGEMGNRAFDDPRTQFLITCDEDTLVARDMLELMAWQRAAFEDDERVLLVNGHSRCCQGWDGPSVKDDPDADPAVVRLLPYFNAWGWGTWRECWQDIIIPSWDWDGTTGEPNQGGYDWQLSRVVQDYLAGVPDASRTQHIGEVEGMFSTPESLVWSKAASFRERRDPVQFRLEPWP